jgi:putative phage-type endonuclease
VTAPTVLGRWEPGSDEWHAARTHGVGGSEIAPILGISPFESRFSLWHRKAGRIAPIDDSPEMEWGRRLEPAILQKYRDEHPHQSFDLQGYTFTHPDRPWQIANPDLYGDDLVEAKCSRDSVGWGEPGTDEIPIYYRTQVLWYMDTLGRDRATVAVLIGGNDYREYVVAYDPVEAAELRAAAEAFLGSLERHERPDIDEHSATYQVIKELHPDIDGTDVEIDADLAARFVTARAAAQTATAAEQLAKNLLADAMGTARRAMWEGYSIATRQARGDGLPYLVAGRKLPDPTELPTTPTKEAA